MPIPFILTGLGVVAGVLGAGGHLSAKETNEKAQRVMRNAQELYECAKESLEEAQNRTEKTLLKLGYAKKDILNSSMQQFLNSYDKIKQIQVEESVGYNEIANFSINQQDAVQLREMTDIYSSSIQSGATGAAAGAIIALAANGSLSIVTGGLATAGSALLAGEITAAAGIAGSALSFGAAMTPLAAIAAPVLLFTGLSASMKADENLEKANYSLDEPGLSYAGGEWNSSKYSSFIPDKDNCIPITDEAYFEDDLVGQFVGWMKKAFGQENLEENLDFIAKALGNKGTTSHEVIRNYFLNDFMKDHIKIYQKRPIYWLFDSGKQNGFKALVYMHRWNADTVGNLRVEYLHKMQHTYEREIVRMQETIDNSRDSREVSKATKRKDKLQKQLKETKDYDAKLAHIALSRIEIDLDDGVNVNYEKVQTGRDGKKMQILAKI